MFEITLTSVSLASCLIDTIPIKSQAYKIASMRHDLNNQLHNMGIWLFLFLWLIIINKASEILGDTQLMMLLHNDI